MLSGRQSPGENISSLGTAIHHHPTAVPPLPFSSPTPLLVWVPSPQMMLSSLYPRHKHAGLFLLWGQTQG